MREFFRGPWDVVRSRSAAVNPHVGGGLALLLAALAALAVVNFGGQAGYTAYWQQYLGTGVLRMSLHHWVNDGLMALFFVLVGMEIKHELLHGSLKNKRQAMLPLVAAVGGVAVPALLFVLLNSDHPENLRGWAVPMATDIAFAVALISMLGNRVPASLRAFLLALAVIDDLIAIVVIALFYSGGISLINLTLGFAGVALLVAMNRMGCKRTLPFVVVGLLTWLAVLESGVHATLAGVAFGLALPMSKRVGKESIASVVEHGLQEPVRWVILPLFAFANMGIALHSVGLGHMLDPLVVGVALGLFAGKQAGVLAAVWLMVKLRLASLPEGANWRQVHGVALACGIGFTMSLFIAHLAFTDMLAQQELALGVVLGSVASAVAAWLCLRK